MTRQGKLAAARCLHLLLAPFLLSSVLCKEERVEGKPRTYGLETYACLGRLPVVNEGSQLVLDSPRRSQLHIK